MCFAMGFVECVLQWDLLNVCVLQWMDGWMDGWMDEEEQTTMEQVMITWNTSHMLVNKHSITTVI